MLSKVGEKAPFGAWAFGPCQAAQVDIHLFVWDGRLRALDLGKGATTEALLGFTGETSSLIIPLVASPHILHSC